MSELPWPALAGYGAGWVLFASLSWLVLRKIIQGKLVPEREVIAKDREIAFLRERNEEQADLLGLVTGEGVQTTNSVLQAIRDLAERQER